MDIEEEAIMANVQHGSFFQEGAGDSHWADGRVFIPSSETNGLPEVADAICLREGHWHKLNKVIIDLDVLAAALEQEELGESSNESDGKDEAALPHELGAAQRKGLVHKNVHD
jgi:hypothetical protein